MQHYPNILLIAGTGRNSGKTTLACKIIEEFSKSSNIAALKISPHFHKQGETMEIIDKTQDYSIYIENNKKSGKDSSLMLNAGASPVYYIEVLDYSLLNSFESLMDKIPSNTPVVCESPALRKFISPGVFFIVDHPQTLNKKGEVLQWRKEADRFINSATDHLEPILEGVQLKSNKWHFKI